MFIHIKRVLAEIHVHYRHPTYTEYLHIIIIIIYDYILKLSSPILNYKHWAWSWSQFLGSQPACDISHKPSGRLPLLSTRPAVTFPAKEINLLGRYQIMLLGDRVTQVQVACARPLCNGAQPGLEPASCKSQVWCPTNSTTAVVVIICIFTTTAVIISSMF